MKYIKILIVLILVTATAPSAHAAGIQVSPSELDFVLDEASSIQKQLVVANPTQDVQVFEVYADEFENAISANPASFTLEAGARKTVDIKIDISKLPSKENLTLATNLSVLSRPLAENRLNINTGVKIPLSLSSIQPTSKDSKPFWLMGAILGLFIWGIFIHRKK